MPTPVEIQEEVRRAAVEGRVPFQRKGAVTQAPAGPERHAPEGVFDPRSLFRPLYNPVWFEMPDGKGVWVHAVSVEEVMELNERAAREVDDLRLDNPREIQRQLVHRGQVWQVILCCRQGPEIDANPVFSVEHAPALRRNPGWFESIARICKLSDLIGAREDREVEALRGFFGDLANWLRTCAGQLSTGSPETWRERLEACAEHVSSIRQRGSITVNDAAALPPLE